MTNTIKATRLLQTYNGWKNRATWNVALWIGNDEPLYRAAVDYVKRRRAAGKRVSYRSFCQDADLTGRTPDRIAWLGRALDCKALSEMLNRLVNQ